MVHDDLMFIVAVCAWSHNYLIKSFHATYILWYPRSSSHYAYSMDCVLHGRVYGFLFCLFVAYL